MSVNIMMLPTDREEMPEPVIRPASASPDLLDGFRLISYVYSPMNSRKGLQMPPNSGNAVGREPLKERKQSSENKASASAPVILNFINKRKQLKPK